MKSFARLYLELDATTSIAAKHDALVRYYATARADDAAWATYFLAGGRPRQTVPSRVLREFTVERSGLAPWLFEECYHAVGDLAETIAHLLPPPSRDDDASLAAWVERLIGLRGLDPALVRERLAGWTDALDWNGRFLLVKLIGGGFRVGVSKLAVTRALATSAGVDAKTIAQRLIGYTGIASRPDAAAFDALVAPAGEGAITTGHPYPFFLAHPLAADPATLGPVDDWLVEWKWDGIRAQLVVREGRAWLWSRGEELVSDRFPELAALGAVLPRDTVIDGEVVVWRDGKPAAFADLQTRIGRKNVTEKVQASMPVVLVAYDLLEEGGRDLRELPQAERRARLERVVAAADHARLLASPLVVASDWAAFAALRADSRQRGVEGFMLKHRDARYGVGRTRADGTWWKWKIDPMRADAVLVYAERGHGRRASLYTDYTFAVWDDASDERRLVPFAKAYSGLTDAEIAEVDAAVRRTTIDKFGPVRSVRPTMVFELGFEAIARSGRHKSGVAVRFPRILRPRPDKPVEEADTLATLLALLPPGA